MKVLSSTAIIALVIVMMSSFSLAQTTNAGDTTTTAAPRIMACQYRTFPDCAMNTSTGGVDGCFGYMQKCQLCETTVNSTSCIDGCTYNGLVSPGKCQRSCDTFTRDTCPTACQIYTPLPTERTAKQCADRPGTFCRSSYSDAVKCGADTNCKWSPNGVCLAACAGWRNANDCLQNYCAWNNESITCSEKTTAAPVTTKATEPLTTKVTEPLTTKVTEPLPTNATEPLPTKATEPATTKPMTCNDYTRDTCPTTCQIYTPYPMEKTARQCTDRPNVVCRTTYTNETSCNFDTNCKWISGNTAGTTSSLSGYCGASCSGWRNEKDCSMFNCMWSIEAATCNVKPINTTAAPTKVTDVPATTSDVVPTKPMACIDYTRETCPATCQIYTPLPMEKTTRQCVDRPNVMCRSSYSSEAACNADANCKWTAGALSGSTNTISGVCSAACSGWRNQKDCEMFACSWGLDTNICSEKTTSAPTKITDVPATTSEVVPTKPMACIDYTRETCPTTCQIYTPLPTERTTKQCTDRPNVVCRSSYTTEAACNADAICRWNPLTAVCAATCAGWRNQKDCEMLRTATELTCSWDATANTCNAPVVTKPTFTSSGDVTKGTTSEPIFTKPTFTSSGDVTKGTTSQPIFTKPMETTTPGTPTPTQCADIKDAKMCTMYAEKWACAWVLRANMCVARPCNNRTGAECMVGDGAQRGCFTIMEKYCSACTARECDSKTCAVSADGTCSRNCFTFATADQCKAADAGCSWDATNMRCGRYVAPPTTTAAASTVIKPVVIDCRSLDSDACEKSAAMCSWNSDLKVCGYPACSTYKAESCPADRCKIRASLDSTSNTYTKVCSDVCPEKFPVFCESTGVCAESRDRCVSCSSNQVLCWNSKCADSLTRCDCPLQKPIRCENNNMCVATKDECEATNTCAGVTCWDGTCITSKTSVDPATGKETINRCPCPAATPNRCDDGTCARSADSCQKMCAEPTPTKCWNGECAVNLASCSCPTDKPIRCKSDNQCAESLDACLCPEGTKKCPAPATSTTTNTLVATAGPRCVLASASCDTTCPADKPARCEFGDSDKNACAATAAECPCPDSAWANAVVVAQINAMADSKLTVAVGEKRRVSASALAYVCRSKREMTARFVWRLVDNSATPAAVVKLPVSVGSTLEVDTTILTPGRSYTLSVVATLVRTGVAVTTAAPSATASITFTVAKPRREVVILGGAQRELSGKDAAVTIAVDPRRLGGDVDANGDFTNIPKVQWTCKCAQPADATCTCPAVLTSILSQSTSYKVNIDTSSNKIPAGSYVISASSGEDNDCDGLADDSKVASTSAGSSSTCSIATQTIKVQADVSPKAQVGIFGVPSAETLLSSVRGVTLYARTNVPEATLYWTVNGNRAGTGNSLVFAASDLVAGQTYNIQVFATAENTKASASASFTVPSKVTGKCSIVISQSDSSSSSSSSSTGAAATSTTATTITALSTPITISSSWSGIDSSKLKYRFGYYLNRGQVWLSPENSELSSFSAIAPMITGTTAREVTFVVVASMGTNKNVGTATCTATLAPATEDETKKKVDNAFDNIRNSGETGDSSRLANIVTTLSGAAQKLSDPDQRKKAQGLAVRAVSVLANTTSTTGSDLSRAERSTIIQGIRSSIGSEETTSDNTNSDDSNKAERKGKVTSMNVTMQDLAIRAIYSAVKTPTNGATDKDALDTENDAKDALAALSNMTIKRPELFKAAVNIGRNLAAQTELGKKVEHKFENISATGIQLPGSRNNKISLDAQNSSISFPEGFNKFSDETNRYSVSATEFKENMLGTNGAPAKKKVAAVVVDFVVQTNGQESSIQGSTQPINISIKLSQNVKDALAKRKQQNPNADDKTNSGAECRYFDENTQSWSTTGVKTESVDAAAGVVRCSSTHLSSYTVFVNEELAAPSSNNGAADSDPNASGLSSGQRTGLIAGVVGGIFVLVALALFVRARRSNATTGQTGLAYEETNMNHLLFAAPANADYDEQEMFGNNHNNKYGRQNEFSNL